MDATMNARLDTGLDRGWWAAVHLFGVIKRSHETWALTIEITGADQVCSTLTKGGGGA